MRTNGPCSGFSQWYHWHTNGTNCTFGSANGTIGITIGTNGITNGTIGKTLNDIGIPLVSLGSPERTHGQPSGQLFPKRWLLSNPNRTKSIMNKYKVKRHRNSKTKTGNRDHIRISALERSVSNYWGRGGGGLKLV